MGMRRALLKVAVVSHSQTFNTLLTFPGRADLGPGPRGGILDQAELNLRLDALFRPMTLSTTARQLVRGLVLLWHDHLDTAHTIAQGIENPDGSLVHAIMHRREPDFWNSKYWWRRVGQHPCFPELARRTTEYLEGKDEPELLAKLLPSGKWDACAFVDACEAAAGLKRDSQRVTTLRAIQQIEFETALEYFLSDKPH